MVEVAESDVQIILSIKEGRNYEQILQPTILVGTLNGHSLKTDKIESSSNPQYDTDLVWETSKTVMKKMRSGQASLKLECYAFKENEHKEKIGHVLLSMRSAHLAYKYEDLDPKATWYKLLGLRSDLKTHKPELLLTLRIENRKNTCSNAILEVSNLMTESMVTQSDEIVPYLHPEERLIQLGPLNTCCELFVLSIRVIHTENLHLLLSEHLTKDNTVYLLYRVLENDVEFKSFKMDERTHFLHEKVVVRIRSSLHVLKHYLQLKPHLSVFLKYESNTIAKSLVNLQSLVPTDNIQEFVKCTTNSSTTLHERCFLTKQDLTEESIIKNSSQQSYLDIQLKLQYIETKTDVLHNSDINMSFNNYTTSNIQYYNEEYMNNKCPEVESHRNPSGDFRKFNSVLNKSNGFPDETKCTTEYKCANQQFIDCQHLKNRTNKMTCLCSNDTTVCNCINTKCTGSYHCYCLHISLVAITFVSPKLSGQRIEFRFHHPKAEITSVARATTSGLSGEKSILQNVGCEFHFISAPSKIKQLLQSFPPKISMYNINEDAKPLSLLVLDLKPLFHQDKPEYQYKLPLYDMDQNKIGNIDVMFKLENCGPHFLLKKETAGKNLGSPILDDSLAYKMVDELETWKERQKVMFKAELKRKEERHLNMLSEEWRRQKENLESKLACSVEQCKILANSLNNATEDLRTRRLKSLENETRLIKANEDIQWRYEVKLQELKDSFHAMQNDLTSKVSKLEEKKTALEAQVEILMYENENLKSTVSKQINELQMYQKGSLTQDQTASLLQELKILEEKLDNAQKGKSFFKEQWGKAVREIHRMKVDHQQAMQVQIKNSKDELKNVDLAEILSADTRALTNDQILLNELQKEIDVIKPKQSFAPKGTYNQIFAPVNNIYSKDSCNSNKTVASKSEEYNERLQTLREERDSLLRTGSYTLDDVVIKKLDTEIRSLLSWVSYVVGYCFTRSQPWNRITACGQKRPTTTREQLPHPVYAVRRSLMRCSGQYNFVLSRTMCESETLINFVRNCPILYDTKNKDYKDNAKKAETWANIAIKLHLDNGAVAKSKWRHLRDSYAKYLRTQSNTAGQCSKKYKHWAWASQMEFLKPHVTTRQTDYIHTDDYSDSDVETKIKTEPALDEYVHYYEQSANEKPLVLSLRKRKSQQNLCSNISEDTFEYLQTGKLQKFMDAVDLLFLSHAQTLKTFSPQKQVAVKLQIAQIINNAEVEQLEELNSLQFSSPSSPSS